MFKYLAVLIFAGKQVSCNSQSNEKVHIDHARLVKDNKVKLPYTNDSSLCQALKNVRVSNSIDFIDLEDGREITYPIQIIFQLHSQGSVSFLKERPKSDELKLVIDQIKIILKNAHWEGVKENSQVEFSCLLQHKMITDVQLSNMDHSGIQQYCSNYL